jgi:hypothetical protein
VFLFETKKKIIINDEDERLRREMGLHFVKSLCKILIKRTTWHFGRETQKKKKEKKIQIVNFYFLSMKNVIFIQILFPFFVFFISFQALLQTAEDFKMKNEIRLEKYK